MRSAARRTLASTSGLGASAYPELAADQRTVGDAAEAIDANEVAMVTSQTWVSIKPASVGAAREIAARAASAAVRRKNWRHCIEAGFS